MKKNRMFEEVVEVLSKKYELVSCEECKRNGQPYGEQCSLKCNVSVREYDFPLVIQVTHSYRSGMVLYFVGEYNSGYPLSDFNDNDYACIIQNATALTEEECAYMVPFVREKMEEFSERVEDYLDEIIEDCKYM